MNIAKRSHTDLPEAAAAPQYDRQVTQHYVAGKFAVTPAALEKLLNGFAWPQLSYRILEAEERDAAILDAVSQLDAKLRVSGDNDNAVWERGWGEILERIKADGFEPSLLRPQYFDRHRTMRLDGQYIEGRDTHFSAAYDQLLRRITLARYLKGASKVVELGCGTGTSQLMLAELLPQAKLVASDWATASQEIIRAICVYVKRDILPVSFNMLTLEGWDDLTIDSESCVLTFHALEQLGTSWEPLMDRLLAAKPRFCLHMEPFIESYDPSLLLDSLAMRYHKRRNYVDGWLTRLHELAGQGKVEIMDERRLGFGSHYHEASTVVQWKPL